MDDGQKKIWICLFIVVLAAVVVGILYYFSTPTEYSSEGFLIRAEHGQYGATAPAAVQGDTCSGVTLLSEEADGDGI